MIKWASATIFSQSKVNKLFPPSEFAAMICLSKRGSLPELISKVSNKIQNPGVGISDSRCIVKCDQKSPSVKATHIPPHSSGPGWKIGPTLSSENHYHFDKMPDKESSSLLFASQAEMFWNLYIFSLYRSFFLAKFILIFLFSIQLRTRAVNWRHGGELSLFCWW